MRLSALIALCLLVPADLGRLGIPPRSFEPEISFDGAVAAAVRLPRLYSLLVNWRGERVVEQYFNGANARRPANIKSASKSVIAALVGIAVHRGLIEGVDTPISSYFPWLDADKGDITVEDLLTMRSGLESTSGRNYGAWAQSPSWVRFALARPLIAKPGSSMIYSTGNTHLLSAILTKATAKSTWDFAQEALAEPLGFTLARWARDPEGIYFGGNQMMMTSRQLEALGTTYLNRGQFGDRRILPEAWIDETFTPRGRSHRSGRLYGYGWWMRELAGHWLYYAWGYGGQFIFVVPDLELVAVTTSASDQSSGRNGHRNGVYDLVEDEIISPISSATSLIGYRRSLP